MGGTLGCEGTPQHADAMRNPQSPILGLGADSRERVSLSLVSPWASWRIGERPAQRGDAGGDALQAHGLSLGRVRCVEKAPWLAHGFGVADKPC